MKGKNTVGRTDFSTMEPKVFVISASSSAGWIYCVCDPPDSSSCHPHPLLPLLIPRPLPPPSSGPPPAIYCAGQSDGGETSPRGAICHLYIIIQTHRLLTLCYKGPGKLLFLWDMIKEMLPYVHIFYCPAPEQEAP